MSIAFYFITKAFTGDANLGIPAYQIDGIDIVKQQIFFNNMMIYTGEGINKDDNNFWNKYNLKINVKQNFVKHIGLEERIVSKIANTYIYDIFATRMENFDVIITSRQPESRNLTNPVFKYGDIIYEYLTFNLICKRIRDNIGILYMQPSGNMVDLSYSEDMTGVIKKSQGFSIKYKYKIQSNVTQQNIESVLLEYKSINDENSSNDGEILIG